MPIQNLGGQGTYFSSQSSAPLGTEITTNGEFTANITGWTGTNWAYATGEASHTAGSTAALTQSVTTTNATTYNIVFEITSRTAGSVGIKINNVIAYEFGTDQAFGDNRVYSTSLVSNSAAAVTLNITPTNDFDGDIAYIRVRPLTGVVTNAITIVDEDNAEAIEITGDAGLEATYLGLDAGQYNTTGQANTFVGNKAGKSNVNGDYNTFIGCTAGESCVLGDENVALGYDAAQALTSGYANVIIGSGAGTSMTSGNSNVMNGYKAGENCTGASNTMVGRSAGNGQTSAGNCTLVGYYAGGAQTAGNTVAVGYQACNVNTATASTAMGTQAMSKNTSGVNNTAFGSEALKDVVTGTNNTSIGYSAGENLLGNNNTCAGSEAGFNLTTGSGNTMIGNDAGRFQANGSTILVSPENSIYIGDDARGKDDSDSNSISIGYQAVGLGANTSVIGNSSTVDAKIWGTLETSEVVKEAWVTVAASSGAYAGVDMKSKGYDFVTNATADITIALGNGEFPGQEIMFFLTTKDTNNVVITPTSLHGGSTVTLDTTNDWAHMMYTIGGWVVLSSLSTIA